MPRTLAIGDIHGCLHAFDSLLALIDLQPDDVLVTLGDYVDRGPDSKGVLSRLLELKKRCGLVPLKGNHDLMMLAACEDQQHFNEWMSCGGRKTVESYGPCSDPPTLLNLVPVGHWQFLADDCLPYHEAGNHFFVHGNVEPDVPLGEQPEDMLFWKKLVVSDSRPHQSGKRMICGHTQQRSGRPLALEHAVCIDTWVYGDGWLTCLDVDREAYWQANQRGETRMGMLGFSR